jgi:hypothetical protein
VHPRMQLMDRPQTRSEFEHRFHGFREQLRQGRLQGVGESLLDVRYLPNGRLDFLSIDESARSQVNSVMHFANIRFPSDVENPAQEPDRA